MVELDRAKQLNGMIQVVKDMIADLNELRRAVDESAAFGQDLREAWVHLMQARESLRDALED